MSFVTEPSTELITEICNQMQSRFIGCIIETGFQKVQIPVYRFGNPGKVWSFQRKVVSNVSSSAQSVGRKSCSKGRNMIFSKKKAYKQFKLHDKTFDVLEIQPIIFKVLTRTEVMKVWRSFFSVFLIKKLKNNEKLLFRSALIEYLVFSSRFLRKIKK